MDRGRNGFTVGGLVGGVELIRQGISFGVLRTRSVQEGEVKVCEA